MSDIVVDTPASVMTIEAELNYLESNGERPVSYQYEPPPGVPERSGVYRAHRVTISNARVAPPPGALSLDRNGFELHRRASVLSDFSDPAKIESIYYREADALLKEATGAQRVVVFDHTLRTGDEAMREQLKIREVVPRVHNDYTEWSAPQRVRDILPDEAEALLKRRFAIVQVWRPIRHPVESSPLAMCDAGSISVDDLVVSERRYPNRVGQTYAIVYNPDHQWFWFPRMRRDEAIVFKVFDSSKDGRARWSAHSAFNDPTSPPDARPRESIEIRTLAFF